MLSSNLQAVRRPPHRGRKRKNRCRRRHAMRTVARFTGSVLRAMLTIAPLVPQGAPQQQQNPPPPQTPPAPPPGEQVQTDANGQPVFRAGINFVRVDVIATDKQGAPILDLTKDDFEITEDNKKQTVETFRLVKIDTNKPVETSAARIRT